MKALDTSPLFRVTPLWLWPVLAWNLWRFRAWWAVTTEGKTSLARVFTDGRGHVFVEWISPPQGLKLSDLSHNGPSVLEVTDLDLYSVLVERQDRLGLVALASVLGGDLALVLDAPAPLEPG